MRRFYGQDTQWESFSATPSLQSNAAPVEEVHSEAAVIGEIALVLAVALGFAALIGFALMWLHVRPYV